MAFHEAANLQNGRMLNAGGDDVAPLGIPGAGNAFDGMIVGLCTATSKEHLRRHAA